MSSTIWFHVLCQYRLADWKKTRSHYINVQSLLEKKNQLIKNINTIKINEWLHNLKGLIV